MVIPFGFARPADPQRRQLLRVRRIGHVEQRQLRALDASVEVGTLADADQQTLADRMQVRRVAGDLQLAAQRRRRGITEIDHVQRIGLAERDDVTLRAEESHGVDLLVRAEPIDEPDLHELVALGPQHSHGRR